MSGDVRVTFAELIVPAHTRSTATNPWGSPGRELVLEPPRSEVRVPEGVTVAECLGAAYDPEIKAWRVLTRRYVEGRRRA